MTVVIKLRSWQEEEILRGRTSKDLISCGELQSFGEQFILILTSLDALLRDGNQISITFQTKIGND